MKEKDKKVRFTAVLLMIGFIPLLLASVIICVTSAITTTRNLEEDVYKKLFVAADGLRQYYQYDIEAAGGTDGVDYEHDYVDMLTGEDIQMTLFIGDTRFITSAKNEKGERNEGTQMDSTIWASVKAGNDYQGDKVPIGGQDYYVYYTPLRNGSEVVGAAWAGQPEADVKAAIRSSILSTVVIVIVSCIVFAVIIVFVARKIIAVLGQVVEEVDVISKGKLNDTDSTRSVIHEIDSLSANIASLRQKLHGSISDIKDKAVDLSGQSKDLDTASSENAENISNLSRAIEEIATGATSQAEEVQSAAENVANIVNTLDRINESVSNTKEATGIMEDDSRKVVSDFDILIKDTNVSIEKLQEISDKMDTVSKAVEAVTNAAEEINGIASQTNLLSLNASIEAARAGEAGRGFAVVAGEISTLSDQSNQSAATIKDIMANLMQQTTEAVNMVSELSTMMNEQGETSKQSQESLQQLIGAIERTKEQVDAVKEGSDAVSGLCTNLNSSIQNLSAISEENAASAEETSASIDQVSSNTEHIQKMSDELKGVADDLSNLTAFFTV